MVRSTSSTAPKERSAGTIATYDSGKLEMTNPSEQHPDATEASQSTPHGSNPQSLKSTD
jgi:hypothetical protein